MSVKSKQRVADHGEVFTSEREVNAMLDLVVEETQRIESRFLEPACGDGNFLIAVLQRKLDIIGAKYRRSRLEYERYAVIAVGSIYGVELLEDNVQDCRRRLHEYLTQRYAKIYKAEISQEFLESIWYILQHNIIWGDALTLTRVDGSEEPIMFCEWSLAKGSEIKRKDYKMCHLMNRQLNLKRDLFSDLGDEPFILKPAKEYPLAHYLRLKEYA